MNKHKVLAILGSPHPTGVTALMLQTAVNAARQAGHSVTTIPLYEKKLAFCTGCRTCLSTKSCVQQDDIQEIAALFRESQTVLCAAPVYWANVPAVVKNLFDRLLGVAMEETRTFPKPCLSGKQYLLFTACNTPAPFSYLYGQSRGALRSMEEFFQTAGMKCMGKFVCTNAAHKTELPQTLIRKIERCWKGR